MIWNLHLKSLTRPKNLRLDRSWAWNVATKGLPRAYTVPTDHCITHPASAKLLFEADGVINTQTHDWKLCGE